MKASKTFLALALSAVVSTVRGQCNLSCESLSTFVPCEGAALQLCQQALASDAANNVPDVTIPDVTIPDGVAIPAATLPTGVSVPTTTPSDADCPQLSTAMNCVNPTECNDILTAGTPCNAAVDAVMGGPSECGEWKTTMGYYVQGCQTNLDALAVPPLTLPPSFSPPELPANVEVPEFELPADVTVPTTEPDRVACPGYHQLQDNNCIDPTNDCEQIVTDDSQCNQAIVSVANTAGCGAWQGIAAQILQGCNAELEAGLIAAGITGGVAGMGQDMSDVLADSPDVLASLPDVSGVTDTANDVADAASGAVSDVVGDTGDTVDAAGDAAGDAADAAGDAAGDAADAADNALSSLNAGQRPGAGLPAVALLAALAMVMSGFPM